MSPITPRPVSARPASGRSGSRRFRSSPARSPAVFVPALPGCSAGNAPPLSPAAQSVRRRTVLIGRHSVMRSAHRFAAASTTADMHLEQAYDRLRLCGNVRHRCLFDPLWFQSPSAEWTLCLLNGYIDWGRAGACRRLRTSPEVSFARFSSRPFGMLFSLPLGKWRGAPMLSAPQFLDLLPQLLVLA